MRILLLALLLLLPGVSWAKRHTVKSGDTLGEVGKRYGCKVSELRKANKLKSDSLAIGQKLKIPRCKGRKRTARGRRKVHKVKTGDTLGELASKYKCSIKQLKKANGLKGSGLQLGQKLAIPYCDRGKVGRMHTESGGGGVANPKPLEGRTRKRFKNGRHKLDKSTLVTAMKAHGFGRPRRFMAYVLEVTLSKNQRRIIRERSFAWDSTGNDPNWNPASTIKLFSAISALEMTKAKGFTPSVRATFYDAGRAPRDYRVSDLVSACLIKSDNIAHNRLVQLAGWDYLNGRTLRRRGHTDSAIHKPYEKSVWVPLTGTDHFKDSPKVRLQSGGRVRTLQPRAGKGQFACMGSSACTTMKDLAQAIRRLMLHEQLPARERYALGRRELQIIRKSLKHDRKRGMEVVDGIAAAFGKDGVSFYHKPGFSEGWMSDVVYVIPKRSTKRYIVAIAGYRGRSSLNSAARVLGQILKDDELEYY